VTAPHRRAEILDALRRGTVPRDGLAAFAVGMERFQSTLEAELDAAARGRGTFKAVRGEYGSGKTFFARWLQERARGAGFATSEVQVSETETPLHRSEAVYRRLIERLATSDTPDGALRSVVDAWFYTLEEEVLAEGRTDAADATALVGATEALMERRLSAIARTAPAFSAVLRAYRRALLADQSALAEGLIAWMGGQPNVAAAVKRAAGVKGDLDAFGAMHFLAGLLVILRDSGRAGLVLVLDEVETLQRMRADTREKGLNALRQLIDEIDAGRYPVTWSSPGPPLSSMGHRASSDSHRWPSGCTRTLRRTHGTTIRGRSRSGSLVSTSAHSRASAPGSGIFSPRRRPRLSTSQRSWTMPTSTIWRARSLGVSAGGRALPRACS
jgi:hypothetical protein